MNVYEESHNLAHAIKESEEYKQYDNLKKAISNNTELSTSIKAFQKIQFEIQANQLTGQASSPELMRNMEEMYQTLLNEPVAAQYLQAEMRFSVMMSDVYKILGEVMGIDNQFPMK